MTVPEDDPIRALRVMVVDDDAVFRRYLEAQLTMLGCQFLPVESGDLAWAQMQTAAPDLVLTDVFMPGMSGLDLCRRIKSSSTLRNIPVILLTMLGAKVKDEGYQAGADDFLNKPPHLLELRTRIRNLLLLRSLQTQPQAEAEPAFDVPLEDGSPARILLLESHGILREHARAILAEEGWEVEGLDTQDRLLEHLRSQRPDLLIIDQDLLEGPGSALVSRLRSQALTQDLSILLMCEAGALELQTGGWQSEADEHLVKPFEASELKVRVRSLLKQAELRRRKEAQAGNTEPGSLRDPQSGAFSQAYLFACLEHLNAVAALQGTPMGLLGVRTAAQLGGTSHQVATLLASQLKPHEILCSVGPGIFVAILPGADDADLSTRVSAFSPSLPGSHFVTVSGTGLTAKALLKRAWDQLKDRGRTGP